MEKNKMEIKYNKKLYNKKALEAGIEAYEGLADFVLSEEENYFILNLKNIKAELSEVIVDEFSNFVLAQAKG
ncbi:MAG: HxsD-like protein [Candidatus Magasanikbacteria bacterium]|nr:HxsD-like protein [Candidatus Magasanikbacteria bacterium]